MLVYLVRPNEETIEQHITDSRFTPSMMANLLNTEETNIMTYKIGENMMVAVSEWQHGLTSDNMSIIPGMRQPIAGNAILFGLTESGKQIDPPISMGWYAENIRFRRVDEVFDIKYD